jgi:hypothetical protein
VAVEDAYELAYREAVRTLEHQRSEIAELCSRASLLLATASISLSLLGHEPFGSAPVLAWLVVCCFVLLSLCVLAMMWPHTDGTFCTDPQGLLAGHLASGAPDRAVLRLDLIARIATHHRGNARRLAQTSSAFRIGACLLAIQMLLTLTAATVTV